MYLVEHFDLTRKYPTESNLFHPSAARSSSEKNLPFIFRSYANVKAKLIHVKDIRHYIPHDKRQMSNLLFLLCSIICFGTPYHIAPQYHPSLTTDMAYLWDRESKR